MAVNMSAGSGSLSENRGKSLQTVWSVFNSTQEGVMALPGGIGLLNNDGRFGEDGTRNVRESRQVKAAACAESAA